jgi:hypothetical protein
MLEFRLPFWQVPMSHCSVCGQEYGLTHNCAGIAPLTTADEAAPPPNLRFAPLYYLDEAFKIMSWDDAAVRRASHDNNSLLYGFLILAVGTVIPFGFLAQRSMQLGYPIPWALMATHYPQTLAYTLAWIILQVGLSHYLAKLFFDAKGSYLGVMRAYMLGQLFRCLIIVPVAGNILAGLGGIAVLMIVFEEVDGIERMKAFGLAATIGVAFWIGSIWWMTSGGRPTILH